MPLPVNSQRMTSPASGRPRERSLAVWAPTHRIGDARDVVVLHVLADAAQFMHDRHADAAEMLGIADPRQLQDVRRADRARRQDHLARRIGPLDGSTGPPRENSTPIARLPSNRMRCTSALVTSCRFGRFSAGCR